MIEGNAIELQGLVLMSVMPSVPRMSVFTAVVTIYIVVILVMRN